MAIATSCQDCGRDYKLKDELAGKKFKCKDCGAVVVVPAPRQNASSKSGSSPAISKKSPSKSPSAAKPTRPVKKSDDDDFLDALNSNGLSKGDNFEDDEDQEEVRPVAKKKTASKKSATKKKKSSGSSSGLGEMHATQALRLFGSGRHLVTDHQRGPERGFGNTVSNPLGSRRPHD